MFGWTPALVQALTSFDLSPSALSAAVLKQVFPESEGPNSVLGPHFPGVPAVGPKRLDTFQMMASQMFEDSYYIPSLD